MPSTSSKAQINKTEAITMLGLQSVDDLNLGLIEYAQALKASGTTVPAELEDPEKSETISKALLTKYRDFVRQAMSTRALSAAESGEQEQKGEMTTTTSSAPPAPKSQALEIETEFSQQALQGALATLQQIHQGSATVTGLTIADEAWFTLVDTIVNRTEQRASALAESMTADIKERLEALQTRQGSNKTNQSQRLGELNTKYQGYISQLNILMEQAQNLPL